MPTTKKAPPPKPKDKVGRKMAGKSKQATIKVQAVISTFIDSLTREQENQLRRQASMLMEPGKGIVAVDESVTTIDKCLCSMKMGCTERNRARYLDVLIGDSRELCQYASGVLLTEDLTKLKTYKGRYAPVLLHAAHIQLGIRADRGFVKILGTHGEWATVGLDTLEEDCKRYKEKGAGFALWRCVYKVSRLTPSTLALTVNSYSLARFASVSQVAGLIPILSAELLPDGDYDLQMAQEALREVLSSLMASLHMFRVQLESVIIRLTPVFPGVNYTEKYKLADVVRGTLQACNSRIPAAVAGVMLSRRETLDDSVEILNELNKYPMKKPHAISFCYSRVIHNDVITVWAGHDVTLPKARNLLLARAKMCSLASMGQYPERNQSLFISAISGQ